LPYCSFADLFAFGAPRGATPNPARPLASAVSDVCTLDQHGFETGDEIVFRPAGDGVMPSGLDAGVTYYAQYETEHTFRVRATASGAAIAFDDAEDPLVVIAPLARASFIAWADRMIDEMCPGQAIPFDDVALYPGGVPEVIRMTSAELAAGKMAALSGSASRSLAETVDLAQKRLERWAKGLPVRGTPDATRTNLAASAPASSASAALSATSCAADPRGWRRYGGI
jgi:hypothetical protein